MARVRAATAYTRAMRSSPPASSRPRANTGTRGSGRHEIRIIGGQWRRTRLQVPDKPGLRPTPDRVRETLFNWLGQDLTGWRCVDAFAGTGVLGLEAASRGAAQVLAFEQDAQLVALLQEHVRRLQADAIGVQRGDALAAMARQPAQAFDLVFLDPPFDTPLFGEALQSAARLVPPGGWVYLEAPRLWTPQELEGLQLKLHKHLKAGAVHAHLLERTA